MFGKAGEKYIFLLIQNPWFKQWTKDIVSIDKECTNEQRAKKELEQTINIIG